MFALWLICLTILLVLGRQLSYRRPKIRRLVTSENGAAYSLSLALITPLYTLMICFLIELTLMLNVQIGVDYAAYAAARSAIVWLPAEVTPLNTQQQLVDMVHLAAAQAITPYASSLDKHRRSGSTTDAAGDEAYLAGYNDLVTTGTHQVASYVQQKRQYAMAATKVEFDPPLAALFGSSEAEIVKATVRYEMPFNIPGVGMILGKKSASGIGYVRELTSTVTLQLERPKTKNGTLGFEYDSRPVNGESPDRPKQPAQTGVAVLAGGYEGIVGGIFKNEWDAAQQLAKRMGAKIARLSDRPDCSHIDELVINAHGMYLDESKNQYGIRITGKDGKDTHFTAAELASLLREMNFSGRRLQLVICHSATTPPAGGPSFAEALSVILNVRVVGYPHLTEVDINTGIVWRYEEGFFGPPHRYPAEPIEFGVQD